MTEEQYKAEMHKANLIIGKLEQQIGELSGRLAQAESERDIYVSYINSLAQVGQETPEEAPEETK